MVTNIINLFTEVNSMEQGFNKCNFLLEKEQECHHYAATLCKQVNDFTNSYAFKYPDCTILLSNGEKICKYKLKEEKVTDLNNEQKNAFIQIWDKYFITPENVLHHELNEEQKLTLFIESFDEYRTPFRKEEERIIYTEAFRRLQYKTQVMINSASDDQRTRLLHSLEVQKISRKIAVALKANYELTDAIAIAHDIGHSPFGHAGEGTIKAFLENQMAGSFSHALQSVKVIDYLCSHRALKPKGLKGLGVSDLVLEGILKHDSDSFSDNMASAAFRLQYECDKLYKPVGAKPSEYPDNEICIGGIESQIVCWADKIAYMSHDWEEFVEVGLLEVMLSRINEIIIRMNDFISNSDTPKYEHISDIESKNLHEIDEAFEWLKKSFYSDECQDSHISQDDIFIVRLKKLIEVLKNVVELQQKYPNSFVLFSNEQYKTLHSFFNVAYAWIKITDVKPKNIGGKIDIIFVIYQYLCETTAHRTVPALINALVNSCNNQLEEFNNGAEDDNLNLIKHCNNTWKKSKEKILEKGQTFISPFKYKQRLKKEIKKSFIVKFNNEYAEAVNCISNFTYEEFIESTRVRFMTKKAEMIIEKLMDFYYKNHHMLPLKYRKKIELESCVVDNIKRTTALLQQYYKDRIEDSMKEDELSDKHTNFENIKKMIIDKAKLLGETNLEVLNCSKEDSEKLIETTTNNIGTNDIYAKDAIKLRIIADYISGMTDRMAEKKYNEICSSSTQWSKAFTERGTFNI